MDTATTIEQLGGTCVVTLRGEIDVYTAPPLRNQLHRLIDEEGALVLVIDLSAVSFLDSSALGVLVGALRRLREAGGALRIVEPRTPAARIFSLTGLDTVMDLYATRDDALSSGSA